MKQGLGILRLGFLPTLLTCGFLNAGGTTRAAPVDTQYMTNVLLFENGLFQSQDPQGPESLDPITSAVDQSDGQGQGNGERQGTEGGPHGILLHRLTRLGTSAEWN